MASIFSLFKRICKFESSWIKSIKSKMKKVHQKSCDILFLWKNLHHVSLAFAHNQLYMITSYYQSPIINPNHTVAATTSYPSVIGTIKVVHGMSCMIQFVCLLFGFKISSYKSEEIELTLSFKSRIIQILRSQSTLSNKIKIC